MEKKKPMPVAVSAAPVTGDSVAAYLREHPDFLLGYPDIAPLLTPPARDGSDGVVDFGRFLVDRLRAEIAAHQSRETGLIATVESNVTGQGRIHRAALKLLAARVGLRAEPAHRLQSQHGQVDQFQRRSVPLTLGRREEDHHS